MVHADSVADEGAEKSGGLYEPELGQAIFGQPTQQFSCPEIMDACLLAISNELHRVLWNLRQDQLSPFSNSSDAFKCAVFGVWAYSWSDDELPYNFCHPETGLKISWYKYFGRGMSVNMAVTPELANTVLESCLTAIRSFDIDLYKEDDRKKTRPFEVGSVETVPYFGDRTDEHAAKDSA